MTPWGLVGSGGGFAGFYFLEEPDDSYAEEAEEGKPAEDVYEGPVGGLALELTVEGRLRGGEGIGGAEGIGEEFLQVAQGVLELLAGLGDVVGDQVLVDGGAADEEGLGYGDSDGAADVAHEVEEAAGVTDLVVAQGPVGGGADGNEDEGEAESGDEDG